MRYEYLWDCLDVNTDLHVEIICFIYNFFKMALPHPERVVSLLVRRANGKQSPP